MSRGLFLLPILLVAFASQGQAVPDSGVSLLVDLTSGTSSAAPTDFMTVGDLVFFGATGPDGLRALWKTDGTAEGTVPVMSSNDMSRPLPTLAVRGGEVVGGALYFSSGSPWASDWELWRSDGTSQGTAPVMEGEGHPFIASRQAEAVLGSALLLFESRGAQIELWRVEGTTAERVARLPGFRAGRVSRAVDGRIFFGLSTAAEGEELWLTDGTAAGTARVKDIRPGSSDSAPGHFEPLGGALFFTADDGTRGNELWKTNGTEEGTQLVWDGRTGGETSGILWLHRVGERLVFGTYNTSPAYLWASDGTAEGTRALASGRLNAPTLVGVRNVLAAEDRLFFAGSTSAQGEELWVTDGSEAGTRLVKEVRAGSGSSAIRDFTLSGGLLFFTAEDGGGTRDLWRSDGTSEGTFKVRRGPLSGFWIPDWTVDLGGTPRGPLLFADDAPGVGVELWSSDGTVAGTTLLKDVRTEPTSSDVRGLRVLGERLLFTAHEDAIGPRRLWSSDGTAAGTRKVVQQPLPSTFQALPRLGAHVYFPVEFGTGASHLWRSDGTEAGTARVQEGTPTRFLSWGLLQHQAVMGEGLFFNAHAWEEGLGEELWRTDGTSWGTRLVKDIRAEGDSAPRSFHVMGGVLYFTADDGVHGRELWRSDGTEAGTWLVKDIQPGGGGALLEGTDSLAVVGNTLYLAADDGVHGTEPWKTDGTPEGTSLVLDVEPGSADSHPIRMQASGGKLVFSPFGPPVTRLWETDGTTAGTRLMEVVGPEGPVAVEFLVAEVEGVRFYSADRWHSLWRSDGTAAGTRRIFHLPTSGGPGDEPAAYGLWSFTQSDGVLYFISRVQEGDVLWRTDGTPEGTVQVARVQAPSRSPSSTTWPDPVRAPVRYRGHLVFAADDAAHGRELWRLPLALVTCPGAVSAEATSAEGAQVTYRPARLAEDARPGTQVHYSMASGSTFALGRTVVTAEAVDPDYPLSTCTFTVTVRDTTAPQLQCPENIRVHEEKQGQGAPVSFDATVSDAATASPALVYSTEPGSVFHGTRRVDVAATDAAGNTARCSFTVTVLPSGPFTGCGCGEAPGPGSWLWLGVLGLWVRWGRRRAA
jgi:ELWxxDGT repeat protein